MYLTATFSSMETSQAKTHVYVYANSSMTNVKSEFKYGEGDTTNDEISEFWSAGTYYVCVETTRKTSTSGVLSGNVNIVGAAIPLSKIMTVESTVSKKMDSATVTMKSALGDYVKYVQFRPDTKASDDCFNYSYWKRKISGVYTGGAKDTELIDKQDGGYSTTVTKNGKVTFMIVTDDDRYAVTYKVSGIDTKKPTVTGVKNGKTYKKAVTIEFSDAGSGVKSAKLNGKKIKTGKTVSASGSYTLVVTDKAGNTKTVKFKIK